MDCHNDNMKDCDMCLGCKEEHDDANEYKCTWVEITE